MQVSLSNTYPTWTPLILMCPCFIGAFIYHNKPPCTTLKIKFDERSVKLLHFWSRYRSYLLFRHSSIILHLCHANSFEFFQCIQRLYVLHVRPDLLSVKRNFWDHLKLACQNIEICQKWSYELFLPKCAKLEEQLKRQKYRGQILEIENYCLLVMGFHRMMSHRYDYHRTKVWEHRILK